MNFSGLLVSTGRQVRGHTKRKGPEKNAAAPKQFVEHRRSQHGASLFDHGKMQ